MSGKKFVYDKGLKKDFLEGDNLVISVFFDGTQNNKTNTESFKGTNRRKKIAEQGEKFYNTRLNRNFSVEEEPVKPKDNSPIYGEFKIKEVQITPPIKEKADSYENDYTNIARLWESYTVTDGVQEKIYIEGVGTQDNAEDDAKTSVPFGLFANSSIKAKSQKACDQIIKKLNPYTKPGKFINTLTIDVYGFSRGATTARYFTHFITCTDTEQEVSKYYEYHGADKITKIGKDIEEACKQNFKFLADETLSKTEKTLRLPSAIAITDAEIKLAGARLSIEIARLLTEESHDYFQQQLKKKGIKVNHINIRFIGLYDTVSSYGLFYDNDVEELHLDAVNKAQKVVQIAAADEYRKNFDLTNIRSAGFKGIELFLPGVHCDVGGAYTPIAYEKTAFYVTTLYDEEGIAPSNIALGPVGSWIKEAIEPNAKKFRNKLEADGWLLPNQSEFVYKYWLNDSLESLVLAGVFKYILSSLNALLRGNSSTIKHLQRKMDGMEVGLPPFGILYGHRMVSNKYSFIPLEIMADFSIEMGVPINKGFIANKKWTIDGNLQYTKKALTQYKNKIVNLHNELKKEQNQEEIERMKRDGLLEEVWGLGKDIITSDKQKKYLEKSKEISYKDFLTNKAELHKLRNNYLHWSAKSDSFGYDPVTRSHNYENTRVIHEG